jgi:hypothetical protein
MLVKRSKEWFYWMIMALSLKRITPRDQGLVRNETILLFAVNLTS